MRGPLSRFFKRHPWLAVLVLVAVFVSLVAIDLSKLHRARDLLGQGTFDSDLVIGIGITAALTVIAILVMTRRPTGRARKVLGLIAIGAWFVAFAWEHPRYSHASMTSSPDVVLTVAGDLPLVLLAAGFLVLRAAGRTWTPARQPAPALSGHSAGVWHVVDNQKRPTFDPYYIAHCSCDWTGTAHSEPQAEQQAFQDARAHTPDVDARVQRPLG